MQNLDWNNSWLFFFCLQELASNSTGGRNKPRNCRAKYPAIVPKLKRETPKCVKLFGISDFGKKGILHQLFKTPFLVLQPVKI
jgi:hypothetical protein